MRRHDTTATMKRAARAGGALVARATPQSAMLCDLRAMIRASNVSG